MKLAVVGSINTDMTVTAERIPLKGETLMGDSLSYIPGGKVRIRQLRWQSLVLKSRCSAALVMMTMDAECWII